MKFILITLLLSNYASAQLIKEYGARLHFDPVFTQGLIIEDGIVTESSGLYGKSLLTKWNLKTGKIIKQRKFDKKYFAEGLTELDGLLYMLTWRENTAFVIDKKTFETLEIFNYEGEGWGLTNNGKQLIMSNGSDTIQFINPTTFKVQRSIHVKINNTSIKNINELEWINDEIWANIYQTDYIVVINPQTGEITQKFYLPHLIKGKKPGVLNGIAYDKITKKTWVTGKKWRYVFEL